MLSLRVHWVRRVRPDPLETVPPGLSTSDHEGPPRRASRPLLAPRGGGRRPTGPGGLLAPRHPRTVRAEAGPPGADARRGCGDPATHWRQRPGWCRAHRHLQGLGRRRCCERRGLPGDQAPLPGAEGATLCPRPARERHPQPHLHRVTAARGSWGRLGGARGSWERLRAAAGSSGELGAARGSWGRMGAAGGSWERLGAARGSSGELGAAGGQLEAAQGSSGGAVRGAREQLGAAQGSSGVARVAGGAQDSSGSSGSSGAARGSSGKLRGSSGAAQGQLGACWLYPRPCVPLGTPSAPGLPGLSRAQRLSGWLLPLLCKNSCPNSFPNRRPWVKSRSLSCLFFP